MNKVFTESMTNQTSIEAITKVTDKVFKKFGIEPLPEIREAFKHMQYNIMARDAIISVATEIKSSQLQGLVEQVIEALQNRDIEILKERENGAS